MVKQRWFHNRQFVITLLGCMCAIGTLAAKEVAQWFGFVINHGKGGKRQQQRRQ